MQLTIVHKFIAYLVVIGILPLLAVGLVSYAISSEVVHRETRQYTRILVQNQGDYLELQFIQLESLLTNISGVEEIRSALNQNNVASETTYSHLTTQARIGYILNNYSALQGLVSIDIFTQSGAHYRIGDTLDTQNIDVGVVQQLYEATLVSDNLVLWYGVSPNVNAHSSYQQVVTLSKILYKINPTTFEPEPVALLLGSYSVEYLYQHFSRVNLGQDAYLLVVDAHGVVIYHPQRERIGTAVDPLLLSHLNHQQGTLTETVEGQTVSISYTHLEPSGWVVASLIPTVTLDAKTTSIRTTTLLVVIIFVGVVAIAAFGYSRTVVNPLRHIIKRLQALQANEPPATLKLPDMGQDEIGELGRWFNRFLDNLVAREQAEAERERLIAELKLATELAQESSRLKSEFLATVSHELRTPLNAIEGFTNIMLAGMGVDLNPMARDMVGRIGSNSKRLLNLINDFLDITRIESGRLNLVQTPLAVSDLIEKWRSAVSVLKENKRLDFEIELDPRLPPTIVGDEEALSKIVLNLLDNAFKFTHSGKVSLHLSQSDKHLTIVVSDSGIGIPPYALGYIFDEFRQVDQSSKRLYGGTGLGLAIVQKLVTALGGSISVQSEVGSGSTFTVVLPVRQVSVMQV